eukprot:TRINITY_DN15856_c0_g1_i1.p1 TRINITY_DN15856_c0_g1~~TRINITY_DN15856_c0_g1_i1.p1  ORF type:complete len:1949 (+),score=256.38 TRINITY_DN15856_c0_g1_i1:390-5849(+)
MLYLNAEGRRLDPPTDEALQTLLETPWVVPLTEVKAFPQLKIPRWPLQRPEDVVPSQYACIVFNVLPMANLWPAIVEPRRPTLHEVLQNLKSDENAEMASYYDFFAKCAKESEADLELLRTAPWVRFGKALVTPDVTVEECPVNLAPVWYTLKKEHPKKLVRLCGGRRALSADELVAATARSDLPESRAFNLLEHIVHAYPERKGDVMVPVTRGGCLPARETVFNDMGWVTPRPGQVLVAPRMPLPLVAKLGIATLRSLACEDLDEFGQKEDLLVRLRGIVKDSPRHAVLTELLQNADDAGATCVHIILDNREIQSQIDGSGLPCTEMKNLCGPALMVYNNSPFTEEDEKGIRRLGEGRQKKFKHIGRFGLGFNSVYLLTDTPMWVSEKRFYCFDPTRQYLQGRGGQKISDSSAFPALQKLFTVPDLELRRGTLFRLPLRPAAATQSGVYPYGPQLGELRDKLFELANGNPLLFLNNVRLLRCFEWYKGAPNPVMLFEQSAQWYGTLEPATCFLTAAQLLQQGNRLDDPDRASVWTGHNRVTITDTRPRVWTGGRANTAPKVTPWQVHWQVFPEMQDLAIETTTVPFASVAVPNVPNAPPCPALYCFLPVPVQGELPFAVNATFQLDRTRSIIRDTQSHGNLDVWNKHLFHRTGTLGARAVLATFPTTADNFLSYCPSGQTPSCNAFNAELWELGKFPTPSLGQSALAGMWLCDNGFAAVGKILANWGVCFVPQELQDRFSRAGMPIRALTAKTVCEEIKRRTTGENLPVSSARLELGASDTPQARWELCGALLMNENALASGLPILPVQGGLVSPIAEDWADPPKSVRALFQDTNHPAVRWLLESTGNSATLTRFPHLKRQFRAADLLRLWSEKPLCDISSLCALWNQLCVLGPSEQTLSAYCNLPILPVNNDTGLVVVPWSHRDKVFLPATTPSLAPLLCKLGASVLDSALSAVPFLTQHLQTDFSVALRPLRKNVSRLSPTERDALLSCIANLGGSAAASFADWEIFRNSCGSFIAASRAKCYLSDECPENGLMQQAIVSVYPAKINAVLVALGLPSLRITEWCEQLLSTKLQPGDFVFVITETKKRVPLSKVQPQDILVPQASGAHAPLRRFILNPPQDWQPYLPRLAPELDTEEIHARLEELGMARNPTYRTCTEVIDEIAKQQRGERLDADRLRLVWNIFARMEKCQASNDSQETLTLLAADNVLRRSTELHSGQFGFCGRSLAANQLAHHRLPLQLATHCSLWYLTDPLAFPPAIQNHPLGKIWTEFLYAEGGQSQINSFNLKVVRTIPFRAAGKQAPGTLHYYLDLSSATLFVEEAHALPSCCQFLAHMMQRTANYVQDRLNPQRWVAGSVFTADRPKWFNPFSMEFEPDTPVVCRHSRAALCVFTVLARKEARAEDEEEQGGYGRFSANYQCYVTSGLRTIRYPAWLIAEPREHVVRLERHPLCFRNLLEMMDFAVHIMQSLYGLPNPAMQQFALEKLKAQFAPEHNTDPLAVPVFRMLQQCIDRGRCPSLRHVPHDVLANILSFMNCASLRQLLATSSTMHALATPVLKTLADKEQASVPVITPIARTHHVHPPAAVPRPHPRGYYTPTHYTPRPHWLSWADTTTWHDTNWNSDSDDSDSDSEFLFGTLSFRQPHQHKPLPPPRPAQRSEPLDCTEHSRVRAPTDICVPDNGEPQMMVQPSASLIGPDSIAQLVVLVRADLQVADTLLRTENVSTAASILWMCWHRCAAAGGALELGAPLPILNSFQTVTLPHIFSPSLQARARFAGELLARALGMQNLTKKECQRLAALVHDMVEELSPTPLLPEEQQ